MYDLRKGCRFSAFLLSDLCGHNVCFRAEYSYIITFHILSLIILLFSNCKIIVINNLVGLLSDYSFIGVQIPISALYQSLITIDLIHNKNDQAFQLGRLW